MKVSAATVSVPIKFIKCAAPPIEADSTEDTPRKPKSCSLKSTSEVSPVGSRYLRSPFFISLDCVATEQGYQTCTSSVSRKLVSQKHFGSVFSTVIITLETETGVPSATALMRTGNFPPCFFKMYSHPFL